MIPIEKEPPDMYENTRVYEVCIFCEKETDTWHKETNKPVCSKCAEHFPVEAIKLNIPVFAI